MPGERVRNNRYRMEREIGGNTGKVYLAFDQQCQMHVAIKVFTARQASDYQIIQQVQVEARALSQLRHPNIVQLLDAFQERGNYYLVMEYVDGPTLQQILNSGPLPVSRAVQITEVVCQVLTYMHGRGLIHRDIKASNIMLAGGSTVKVADFGIAQPVENRDRSGRPSGSLESMAPEVIQGNPADQRSDVYSVGVVLYQMLTGRLPFRAEDAAAVAYQHVVTPPPRMDHVPEAVSRVVMIALAKEPQGRYPSMDAFAAALHAAAFGGQAGPSADPVRHRRPWLAVLIGLLLIVILILLVYVLLNLIGQPSSALDVSSLFALASFF